MKNKKELCNKCEKILDQNYKYNVQIEDIILKKIESFIVNNFETLKNEKEYKTLFIKYMLIKERRK